MAPHAFIPRNLHRMASEDDRIILTGYITGEPLNQVYTHARLFVGFSSPMKEIFLKRQMPMMQVPFCMGVGGSFDIVAERTKRAPLWMQKGGLEWVFRIYQEPGRMWKRYAKTNPVFVWMVLKEYIKVRKSKLTADTR